MNDQPNDIGIIVIDDESFMLKLLAHMLERLGYTNITACDSGARGLACLAAPGANTELIFLDINMPDMDGVELIRQLASRGYSGGIVVVSGENDRIKDSVERLIEHHGLRLLGGLEKPVTPEQIAAVLAQHRPGPVPRGRGAAAKCRCQPEQLRAAIANGELLAHYQPKVALDTQAVIGMECLVRWQPRQGSLIYPDAFIPMAEEHGMIADITWQVLAMAMNQVKIWRDAGYPLNVAVNVSMKDFAFLGFPDSAAAMARTIGVEPSSITLEVTESCVTQPLSKVLDVLSRLGLKRFRLSIDDFGTGHSSLAQLRDLPFDELKIDRGFVHGAASHPTRRAICTASLRMAHQLNLRVVAEGVERPEDWDLLGHLGCEEVQGYLIARPMPAQDVPSWIDTWTGRHAAGMPQKA